MNKTIVILAVAALAVIGGGLGLYWLWQRPDVLQLYGVVEIQEVRLASKVGGRVGKVLVEEGDKVKAGQPLVIFELPELEASRDQARARLQQAQAEYYRISNGPRVEEIKAAVAAADAARARYDKMVKGWREEEIRQAKSELETARADYKQAEEDLERLVELYQRKSASRAEYDAAIATYHRSLGRKHAAQARYEMVKTGNRPEDIAEAKADWEKALAQAEELKRGSRWEDVLLAQARVLEAKGKLAELDAQLKEAVIEAPEDVTIDVVAVRKGDVVPPNQPVVRVLRRDDLWVRVYVPETELGKVRIPQEVKIFVDSYPDKSFTGVASHVNTISEFTPRNIQSADERRHQVFGIKIRVDDPEGIFKAGMAVRVLFPIHRADVPATHER